MFTKRSWNPKKKTYITEILDEIKYGDKSEWNYGERKKKDILLKNMQTRFINTK